MIKKILILTGLLLALPVFVFADVSYERNPSGYDITSPVHFEVSFDDISEWCHMPPTGNWKVLIWDCGENPFYSELVATPTKSIAFDIDLPIGEYAIVVGYCEIADPPDLWLEGDPVFEGDSAEWCAGEIIFEIIEGEPEPVSIFQMPDDVLGSTTAHIGGLITGAGPFIWLLMGIPFSFVVIKKVIAVLPK